MVSTVTTYNTSPKYSSFSLVCLPTEIWEKENSLPTSNYQIWEKENSPFVIATTAMAVWNQRNGIVKWITGMALYTKNLLSILQVYTIIIHAPILQPPPPYLLLDTISTVAKYMYFLDTQVQAKPSKCGKSLLSRHGKEQGFLA